MDVIDVYMNLCANVCHVNGVICTLLLDDILLNLEKEAVSFLNTCMWPVLNVIFNSFYSVKLFYDL